MGTNNILQDKLQKVAGRPELHKKATLPPQEFYDSPLNGMSHHTDYNQHTLWQITLYTLIPNTETNILHKKEILNRRNTLLSTKTKNVSCRLTVQQW